MQTITKTQVLALFLGSASAALFDDLRALSVDASFNDGNARSTVQKTSPFTKTSAGGECNAQGGCDAEGNQCGSLQIKGVAEVVNTCITEELCGAVGRIGGAEFYVPCWTVASAPLTPTAPEKLTDAVLASNLADVEGLITKTTTSWAGVQDIIVSPRFNYQDGWFTKEAKTGGTYWVETDKPKDNRCFLDLQCDADKCCGLYPDANNRRCTLRTAVNKPVTLGLVTFTPTCPSISADDIAPQNAQDDIAAGALSTANEELDKWENNLKKDAKDAIGYDTATCDQACKDKFDAEWQAQIDKEKVETDKLRAIMGYNTAACDDSCKAVFEAELLNWAQATFEACRENAKAPACANAYEIRGDIEKARAGDGTDATKNYYSGMSVDERTAQEALEADLVAKQEAAIIAAAVAPAAGSEGSSCAGETKCSGTGQCCGNSVMTSVAAGSTPAADQKKDDICVALIVNGASTVVWSDQFGRRFTHTCQNAIKLASSVAAAAIAAYYM